MKKVDWPAGLARDGVTKTILLLTLLGWVMPSGTARVEVARGRCTKQAPIPTWFSLQGVAAISPTECWIASAPLLGDEDGSIWFTDLLTGWSVNLDGQVFRSTNGGQSWMLKATVNGTNLQMIQFFDSLEGWVIGGDSFYHTTNGGTNWTEVSVPAGTWSYGARFFDRWHGVAVGEAGNILRTILTAARPGKRSSRRVSSCGPLNIPGRTPLSSPGDNGVISRSIDGGATWNSIQSGGTVTHDFDAIDGRHHHLLELIAFA